MEDDIATNDRMEINMEMFNEMLEDFHLGLLAADELVSYYEAAYEYLYETQYTPKMLVERGDKMISYLANNKPTYLIDIIEARHDLFTSDREVAAFALAFGA